MGDLQNAIKCHVFDYIKVHSWLFLMVFLVTGPSTIYIDLNYTIALWHYRICPLSIQRFQHIHIVVYKWMVIIFFKFFNHVQSQKNITSNLGVNRSSPFKTGTTSIINIDGGFLFQNKLLYCHLYQERNSTLCWPCLGADPVRRHCNVLAGFIFLFFQVWCQWLIAPWIFTWTPDMVKTCAGWSQKPQYTSSVSQTQGNLTCQVANLNQHNMQTCMKPANTYQL